jgi:hypothetical protein
MEGAIQTTRSFQTKEREKKKRQWREDDHETLLQGEQLNLLPFTLVDFDGPAKISTYFVSTPLETSLC